MSISITKLLSNAVTGLGAAAINTAVNSGADPEKIRYGMAADARLRPDLFVGPKSDTPEGRFADALGFDPVALAVAELRSLGVRTLEALHPKEPKFAERGDAIQAILNAGAAGADPQKIRALVQSDGLNVEELLAGSRLLNTVEQALKECALAWRSTPARQRTGLDPEAMTATIHDAQAAAIHVQATTLIEVLERHLSALVQVDEGRLNPPEKVLLDQIRTLLSAQSQYLAKAASDPAQNASQRAALLETLDTVVKETIGYLVVAEKALPDHLPKIADSVLTKS